ncbi:WD40-repeat-containing domain protein, partial [Hyaloraphidium curvatum]
AAYSGHTDAVRALVVSPGSNRLYSASDDKTVREWDIDPRQPGTRAALRVFKGHHAPVGSLFLAASGDRLYTGSADKTVREWDLKTGKDLRSFKTAGFLDRAHQVVQVALSADGRSLFAAVGDGIVRWDLWSDDKIGKTKMASEVGERETTSGAQPNPTDFALSPDGRYLVSCADDGAAREHLVATGVTTRLFRGHSGPLARLRVFENRMFTSGSDGTVREWDMATG